jgi:molybdopterin-guanine dinucleotide biosynthesis protein A
MLLNFLGKGITCPRKVLINSEKAILQPPYPKALMNMNTPDDADRVKGILHEETLQE